MGHLTHTWIVPIIVSILILGLIGFSQESDATKSKGNYLTETNSKKVCGDRLCSELDTSNDPTYISPEFIQACEENDGTLKETYLNSEKNPKYCDFPDKACTYSQYLKDKCVTVFEDTTEETTPKADCSGAKQRMGRISKMGDRYLRRLLVSGMTSQLQAVRRKPQAHPWATRLLASKPNKLVAVAMANKAARIAWVVMTRGEVYRARYPATEATA